MRVVSLAPSATKIVTALQAEHELVAVTDHCNVDKPSIGGWLTPNIDVVEEYNPDVLLLTDALQDHLDVQTEPDCTLVHVDPRTLSDVYDSITEIAGVLNRPEIGTDVVAKMRADFAKTHDSVSDSTDNRPVVYCEEWSDPPMAAGNWVPEIVSIAGGQYPFVEPGKRSKHVSQSDFEQAAPEYIILNICGGGESVSPDRIYDRGWNSPAVQDNNIFVIDDSLLNQPAPTLTQAATELSTLMSDE